jgi:isocitrate/isopropylmalate dehydrogenase
VELVTQTKVNAIELSLTGGQASIDETGESLTSNALEAAKGADAVLLGAIGGPVRTLKVEGGNMS